ncbi:TetR/AcrR family transcriptional regulator [Pelagibacterium xiamenense]|uniref:TetR/AcrR family transcriptional regulator n=1 Tax=Pelagibacterium xiamenense TaxID=2901140 RepID=UPI001E3E9E52|nr:TetR/AcrR family transcriptional regulator [Pelagibacterium xiamenense]MCD7058500.1 TetR/AcrR family transcriptional regulator [Pelagibacterium xiamenense]
MQIAALELFTKNGFEQTTAAQIAARAGVTERTFFRHFPDKREVLFAGQEVLSAALTEAIVQAPADLPPRAVLRRAFADVTPLLEGNRRFSEPRQHIIAANPALMEREVAKHAALAGVVADALQKRGIAPARAAFAAKAGLVVLGHALGLWFEKASQPLETCIAEAFKELDLFVSPAGDS